MRENKQIQEKFELEMTSVEKRYEELKNQLKSSHQNTLDDVTRQHQQQMINAIETAEIQLTKLKQVGFCGRVHVRAVIQMLQQGHLSLHLRLEK